MKLLISLVFFFCSINLGFAQKTLLVGGYLHVGNGETVESALIAIEDGKISFIKNSLAYSYSPEEWDTIIQLKGRHVYPGFVATNSTLGITEIDAVRATLDFDEVGIFNPHVRSQIAYNVESKVLSTVRTNGILICQPTPRGGIISGSSSIMKTDGWNWEDATISANDGIHLNWPASPQVDRRKDKGEEGDKDSPEEKYDTKKKEIYAFFDMAKAYSRSAENSENFDQRLEAMRACFKGEKRVYIHADELQQLVDIIEFANDYNLKFPVIVGGYDSYLIGRKLADAKIPVMLLRPHSLPENEEDDVDLPYKLPALLRKAGVKFCIQNEGDMEAMNARNLPFLAGTAAAYGLTEEEAVSAISLWACEIMGIDKHYGSLEKGKSATLFVSDGNALDMLTHNLFVAFVDGTLMSLDNSQTALYRKYSAKYARQKEK